MPWNTETKFPPADCEPLKMEFYHFPNIKKSLGTAPELKYM